MTNKKVARKIIVFILVISIALVLSSCSGSEQEQEAKISTQEVKQGNLVIGLYADGRITIPSVNADFMVSGELDKVNVTVGQTVSKGNLLAVLDLEDLSDALKAAERDLAKAKSAYEDAVSSLDYSVASEKIKLDSLYEKTKLSFDDTTFMRAIEDANSKLSEKMANLIQLEEDHAKAVADGAQQEVLGKLSSSIEESKSAVASAEAVVETANYNLAAAREKFTAEQKTAKENYDLQKLKYENLVNSNMSIVNAKYNWETAQAKLEVAKENLENAYLYAPVSGKIAQVNGSVGDWMTGKTGSVSSQTDNGGFVVITDPDKIMVSGSINEGDITGVEIGQSVKVNVDAVGLMGLPGKVTEIDSLPKVDNSGIVTYQVISELDEVDERILDGMSAFTSYIKREKENVTLISNKAIFMEDGKQYVWVELENNEYEKRAVTAGLTNGSQSEIVEGIAVGESVVTAGMDK
ncbi:HlyD family efflux transporter periplasmic adaptor subunit [Alkalibacter mobilis]|uniref:HlyD family efflux transporter periplasmic adaptor subunit n=1 Tax=Alkalibacter mobilis TaxID=2787712 RepID=UPI00189ED6DF|nr:biotin/lipoyl-binding protein [Alkalibacter mobilis]MBF7095689.1 HlyD family efflux transporter periplasmic adaptor subunit [Alkalibacter mobilis]